MLGFNQFLRFHDFAAEGFPAPEKLDTTGRPLEETAAQVIAWINARRCAPARFEKAVAREKRLRYTSPRSRHAR